MKMKEFLFLVTILGANLGQAEVEWITNDLQIVHESGFHVSSVATSDCREAISKAICIVDPGDPNQDGINRPCVGSGLQYVTRLQEIFDRLPETHQKMFCSLKRIFIENKLNATAYASLVIDQQGTVTGARLGLSRAILDANLNLLQWGTWKEQLNFGRNPTNYESIPGLPAVEASLGTKQDFLYFVIVHEFGHIFDFTNGLNKFQDCSFKDGKWTGACTPQSGSWAEFSWFSRNEPKKDDDFPWRKHLCYYFCQGESIPASAQEQVYDSLMNTSFISTYATRNPNEDLADTFAYYEIFARNANYRIRTNSGSSFSIDSHAQSTNLKRKFDYIERFLQGPIKYPPPVQ